MYQGVFSRIYRFTAIFLRRRYLINGNLVTGGIARNGMFFNGLLTRPLADNIPWTNPRGETQEGGYVKRASETLPQAILCPWSKSL